MKLSLAIALSFAASTFADVPSLTPDNYDEMTDGKTVFIKFFAPWCGHCKKMAPDWEKLASEWEGNDIGLIAEVDCTADGKDLCEAEGVKGFPTLKYGDPNSLEDYKGARTYDSLANFARDNLKPVCSPNKLDLCDDEKKLEIEKYMGMVGSQLDAAIEAAEGKMKEAEETFKSEVNKLQDSYQKLMEDKDKKLEEVKSSGLSLMKSVKAAAAKGKDKDEL